MSEIDNISITYSDSVDNIDINYSSTLDNITLNVGSGIPINSPVTSVNGLIGDVSLTASSTLSTLANFGGRYFYVFYHNLNYRYVNTNIFNNSGDLVYANVYAIDSNYVSIVSSIDISGYKVVSQR